MSNNQIVPKKHIQKNTFYGTPTYGANLESAINFEDVFYKYLGCVC